MLAWAIRCAFLVALGVVAVYELDLNVELPERTAGKQAATGVGSETPGASGAGETVYGSELAVKAAQNGHFFVDAVVNGVAMPFLIDTGATFVILSKETASDLGLRPASHEYTVKIQTANGIIESAPVTLRQVQVGNFTAREVEALVTDSPLGGSLLGLSFLKRLESYEVQRDRLVLRW